MEQRILPMFSRFVLRKYYLAYNPIFSSTNTLRMAFKPVTRTFATRFYDSPLFQALQKEYESASETEEKGSLTYFL